MNQDASVTRLPGPKTVPSADVSAPSQVTVLTAFAIIAALYFARDVLIPLALAVLLSILLSPLVALLRRLRVGRVPAVLLAVFTAVAFICAVGGLIGTQIADLASNVPEYAQTIGGKADTIKAYALKEIGRVTSSLGYGASPARPAAAPAGGKVPAQPSTNLPTTVTGTKPTPVEIHQPDPTPLELAERYLAPILSPLGTVGIVFIVAIFILLQQDDLRDRLIRLFGSSDLRRTTVALNDGGRRLSRYFLTQLAINTSFGTTVWIGLWGIGVPSPLLWGVVAGILRFVPYVGSFIAALFPIALAAAVDPGWSMAIWTAALFFVLETVLGQMIEPLMYGNSTGLSPISVVVAAIFWSWLWGPVGLILSTPLTLCLVVLGRHVDRLEFLDVVLGDRPALTPVESFYQRMLSGDQDEARDFAEQLLKERSLTSLYDDVALPGAELAAVDAQRGVLTTSQLERIRDTIRELVDDLANHPDAQPEVKAKEETVTGAGADDETIQTPPPETLDPNATVVSSIWQGTAPVLCVAGRGPLDEAAASMLCQLLSKHGIGARIAPYEAATRGNINLLDTDGVAAVCVSYLDISGKQAHLRYLLQRLRQRMPATPMVVGLWPCTESDAPGRDLRAIIGADHHTRTLHDAVELCVELARESAVAQGTQLAV